MSGPLLGGIGSYQWLGEAEGEGGREEGGSRWLFRCGREGVALVWRTLEGTAQRGPGRACEGSATLPPPGAKACPAALVVDSCPTRC